MTSRRIAVAALVLASAGCESGSTGDDHPVSSDVRVDSADLDSARVRWSDAGITSYRLEVTEDQNYWSRGCTWVTVVSNGVVEQATIDASSTNEECVEDEWTVERSHDLIDRWLDEIAQSSSAGFGGHALDVHFDEFGVPQAMEFDLSNGADEEASMLVTFTQLP